jgi:hypothetical protein
MCLENCPKLFYPNAENGKCDACKTGCKLCSAKNLCQSCIETFNYFEKTNDCIKICPEKYISIKKSTHPSNLSIMESLINCERCNIGCLKCENTINYCTACEPNYFLMQAENKCYTQCPSGFYNNNNENICLKCHSNCFTCKGDDEGSCLSCDTSKKLILNEGYCVKSSVCPPGEIYFEKLSTCKKFNFCIENLELVVPKIFSIEIAPLIIFYTIKINDICDSIKDKFILKWNKNSSLYDKAIISNEKKTYELNSNLLREGNMNFKIDIIFDKDLITSIESRSLLVVYKVK